jgi:hypothetical protein
LRNLNITLTPEVRGVFERFLAGEYPPFEIPEMAQAVGITPQAFAEYQALG